MQLTSTDENDLLLPLYGGVHNQAEWRIFLERFRRRSGADYTSLIFAQGDTPLYRSKEVFAGRNLRSDARKQGLEDRYSNNRMPYEMLRPGRAYHTAEFAAADPEFREFHETFARELGLSDGLIMRIKEQAGTSAWLFLARNQGHFPATSAALLAAVAPHLEVALHSLVLNERQRIRAAASTEGLNRAGVGWMVLGRNARIIDIDPKLALLLQSVGAPHKMLGERPYLDTAKARHAMRQTAVLFANDPYAAPRALTLTHDPRLEALLVPIAEQPDAALAVPVMLVFCRMPRNAVHDRKLMLEDLYGLSSREAELALAISDGQTIAEGAAAMGLTNETARGYSKCIYAKMGVRGQAELVRQIFISSASLA